MEKQLEHQIIATLKEGMGNHDRLSAIRLTNTSSGVQTLADLCDSHEFKIIQDHSEWNTNTKFMLDVIGGMTPDIVLRSVASQQNRIYIEVKEFAKIGRSKEDSQIIRYFLHLLASSEDNPNGKSDIGRSIILAAPKAWFEASSTNESWKYFLDKYRDLAQAFHITLGELHIENT